MAKQKKRGENIIIIGADLHLERTRDELASRAKLARFSGETGPLACGLLVVSFRYVTLVSLAQEGEGRGFIQIE